MLFTKAGLLKISELIPLNWPVCWKVNGFFLYYLGGVSGLFLGTSGTGGTMVCYCKQIETARE